MAADLLDRALELGPEREGRGELLVELAEARIWSGHHPAALVAARAALSAPGLGEDARKRGEIAEMSALGLMRRNEEALEATEGLLERHRLGGPERLLVLATRAELLLNGWDLDRAAAEVEQLGPELELVSDPEARAAGLGVQAMLRVVQGRLVEARTLADDAVRTAEASGVSREVMSARALRSLLLREHDELDEARVETLALVRTTEDRGGAFLAARFHGMAAMIDLFGGAWEDADSELDAARSLRAGLDAGVELGQHFPRGYLAHHRNDLAAASREVDALEQAQALMGHIDQVRLLFWLKALVEEARGRIQEAAAAFRGALEGQGPFPVIYPVTGPDAVRVALAAGDRDAAEEWTRRTEAVEPTMETATATAAALRCRGLMDGDAAALLAAAEAVRASPRKLDRALTLEDAARGLGSSRRAEGIALLEEAATTLEEIGAERHVRRVQALLRERGVQRGPRRRTKATFGWESITEGEQRVLELLAEGLRNREIADRLYISVRTVESHVSRSLAKLGLGSRVELAAEVSRRSGGLSAPAP